MIWPPKPERVIVAGLSAVAIVAILAALAIFYFEGRRDAAPAIEAASDQAVSAELAGEGGALAGELTDALLQQSQAQNQALMALQRAAAQSEDAHAPLDPARADRLRAHDRQLCDAAPHLDGCAQPPD